MVSDSMASSHSSFHPSSVETVTIETAVKRLTRQSGDSYFFTGYSPLQKRKILTAEGKQFGHLIVGEYLVSKDRAKRIGGAAFDLFRGD